MKEEIEKFLKYLASQKGLSQNSIVSYKKDLIKFEEYLKNEKIVLNGLQRHQFRGFLAELNHKKLKSTTVNRILTAIKGFIKYKIRYGYKDSAGILEVESQKTIKKLPTFLFDEEKKDLLEFNCEAKTDFRDKAIFELLLASGMRVSEIVNLNFNDIHSSKEIKITGKGNKERIVLYTDKCSKTLKEYLSVRETFIKNNKNEMALFLNEKGSRLTDRGIRYILYKRIIKISMIKNISPHSMRHTFATMLIKNGADIRSVQTLLGHSSLATTQIYTHLGLDELKDIHYKFHPHGK